MLYALGISLDDALAFLYQSRPALDAHVDGWRSGAVPRMVQYLSYLPGGGGSA